MPKPTNHGSDTPVYRVAVIELDDVVPRRDGRLPNLLVKTTVDPENKFNQLRAGSGRPAWARGHVLQLRDDLVHRGESEQDAVARLRAAGYTVNRDSRTFRVYVLELQPRPAGKKGWLYVGETEKSVEERIHEHVSKARNSNGRLFSSDVAAHFESRREDLEPGTVYLTREASEAAEKALAQRLRDDGYEVTSG